MVDVAETLIGTCWGEGRGEMQRVRRLKLNLSLDKISSRMKRNPLRTPTIRTVDNSIAEQILVDAVLGATR